MYHSILAKTSDPGAYIVRTAQFENDLAYLKSAGYETVVFADLLDYVNGGKLPEKPVMITFDDGQRNNLTYAVPLLEKYGYKAVFSVVGTYIEKAEKDESFPYMTWDDVKTAKQSGAVEIQNHSYNLHGGSARMGFRKQYGETPASFHDSIFNDILKMQSLLMSRASVTSTCFTYPYGYTFSGARQLLQDAGFQGSMTCIERINYIPRERNALFDLSRFNRSGKYTTEQFMKKIGVK
jgi:peptidoglycan/xylan/chitin deacetylase (PgdA/CDA1 family)